MPHVRVGSIGALAGLLLFLLAPGASSGQAGKTSAGARPISVSFALTDLGNVNALPLTYAVSAGYLKEENIELKMFRFQTGGEIVRAVAGGHIDFAPLSLEGIITARAAKADLKAFVKMNELSGLVLLVGTKLKDTVKSFGDMKGKGLRVGVSGLGGGTHRLMQLGLKKAGVSERDVAFIGVGTGATAVAAQCTPIS